MSDDSLKTLSWLPDEDQSSFSAAPQVFLSGGSAAEPRFDEMRPAPDLKQGAGIGNAYGSGRTELIAQTFDSTDGRYEFSGNQDIDAVLIGSRWTITNMTFSFPTSGSFYTDGTEGTESAAHVTFNAAQQTATRYALSLVSSYTNLNFTEITETATTHANLRLSQTNDANVGSAYGNFPSSSTRAGDIWFGRTGQPFYETPAVGNWGQATIMHELGHTLGLKHGQDDYTSFDLAGSGYLDAPPGGGPRYGSAALPSDHDGQAWSLMTYRSAPGQPVTFEGEGFNQPQTFMQNDIAALQHLYGADFTTNGGATTYSWNPNTGEMSINGTGQGAPTGNVILRTVWDGNGVDTYDLSNYTTNLSIDLTPGAFSTFSEAQLANHRAYSGLTVLAPGNVANALLFNGDTRSLIENATGGTGDDYMLGNQATNTLTGNNGSDTLIGNSGSDVLRGGSGTDFLYGDGRPGGSSGVGFGTGLVVKPSGAGNNTLNNAIDVSNSFSLANDTDIIDPTTTPHVTISGTADGNRDYYKVYVNAGVTLTFDIDHTSGFDSFLILYDAAGNQLFLDDDSLTTDGAGGSTAGTDSYLTYTVTTAGYYFIGVGDYASSTTDEPIAAGNTYELQISAAATAGVGGGSGNDTLDGGSGADIMRGGLGNDTYIVDNASDRTYENVGEGNDTVNTSVSYVLDAGESIETLSLTPGTSTLARNLTGNELAQRLNGNAGANRLDGGAGADTLRGFGGNDIYYVDNVGDVILEVAGGGNDEVASRISYTLAAGVSAEILRTTTITGTANIDLTGNEIAQALFGNAGNNRLDGGAGADSLRGYGGNDTYYVDNAADVVLEAAGDGTDAVAARVSYTLGAGVSVETLRAVSSAATTALDLTGNELAQTVSGNAGANRLDGGAGADRLAGYGGNDTYYIDNAGDLVFEVGGQGTDAVATRVSYTLAAGQSVEALRTTTATGTSNLSLVGNELGQSVTGNAGNNLIDGGRGNDTLRGNDGADTFRFATTLGASNIDHIADFVVADDTIRLDRTIFTQLSLDTLGAAAFKDIGVAGATVDSSDRILYDRTTGQLFYDADGSGATARVQFAVLDNKPTTLSSADFFVVA